MNKNNKKNSPEAGVKTYARYGTIAVATTAVVIALVIFLNLLIGQIPSNLKEIDMTDRNLYEISDTSKDFLKTLEYDIDLILLSTSDTDERVSKFVYYYGDLSKRLTVTEIDPIAYPSYLDKYKTSVNSLVVSCPETGKYTSIQYSSYGSNSIIVYEFVASAGTFIETQFDGEGQLTSAIDYVTGEVSQTVYTLTGHGEIALGETAQSLITKANLATVTEYDLLKSGVPADCDLFIINRPAQDLSNDELQLLRTYMAEGGNILLLIDAVDLPNFNALMLEYGLEMQEGYLGDTERYYQQYEATYGNRCVYPRLSSKNSITKELINQAILIFPRAMVQVAPERADIDVSVFLATSENNGILYADETNFTKGMYVMGAVSSEAVEGGTSRLTVISCPSIIEENIVSAMSSMSNMDIFMNAITENFEGVKNVTIQPKSLTVNYNTVPNGTFVLWTIIFIGVIPLAVLLFGFVFWLKRRRL